MQATHQQKTTDHILNKVEELTSLNEESMQRHTGPGKTRGMNYAQHSGSDTINADTGKISNSSHHFGNIGLHTPMPLQAKLQVNEPGDKYEQEADEVADKVMRTTGPVDSPAAITPVNIIQQKCDTCGKEEVKEAEEEHEEKDDKDTGGLQRKLIWRKCANCEKEDEEKKMLQRKGSIGTTPAVPATVYQTLQSTGQPLDNTTRSFMEPRFGFDFAKVQVHNDALAHQSAKQINALAYTHQNNIVFGEGYYNPQTLQGKKLLAHELTHVIQQRSSGTGAIRRAVVPSAVEFHSFKEIKKMTVAALLSYVESQADWFTNPDLTVDEREKIRWLLIFISDNVAAVFGSTKVSVFDDVINNVSSEESDINAEALRIYASAVSARHIPFALSSTKRTVATAIEMGKDIDKLRKSFADYILQDALNEAEFISLRKHTGFVDDVITYHDKARLKPTFQADAGADFNAFIKYNKETSRNPLHYESTNLLERIRNFHRFEKKALERLIINYTDTTKTKPVTLILHSALDHNGAFHRDENLTSVIRNNNILTLMVEGFENLSDYEAQVKKLAPLYGMGKENLIDQVMFAGHGNAKSMQLAGTIEQDTEPGHTNHIKEKGEGLNVKPGQDAATKSLIAEVLKFMADPSAGTGGMSPNNRVVFNACLTGSNRVSGAVKSGDAVAASAEIKTFISTNPSLSTFLQNTANSSITSIGSNASFGKVGLSNSKGQLNIISAGDKELTADKLTYTEKGTEPTGTLRAALESWANDSAGTIAAMQKRVKKAAATWDEKLIKKAYEIILAKYQADAEKIRLVGTAVEMLSEMKVSDSAIVGNRNFKTFQKIIDLTDIAADCKALIETVSATDEGSWDNIALALLQVWMILDTAKQDELMNKIAVLSCNFSVQFTDISFLAGKGLIDTLLKSTASDQAKFRLALVGVLGDNNNDAVAKTYLISLLVDNHFPAALKLDKALGGASTETEILKKLGVFSAPATSKKANIDVGATGTNTVFTERLNSPGVVSNPYGASVFEKPDKTSTALTFLKNNEHVEVIGKMPDWFTIQFVKSGSTVPVAAFISIYSVDTLKPYENE